MAPGSEQRGATSSRRFYRGLISKLAKRHSCRRTTVVLRLGTSPSARRIAGTCVGKSAEHTAARGQLEYGPRALHLVRERPSPPNKSPTRWSALAGQAVATPP